MSAFDDVFRGIRAHGSLFGRSTLTAPWSLHFVDGAPLTSCTAVEGSGWVIVDGQDPVRLGTGDTVVVRGPRTFRFVDAPDTRAPTLECGEACAEPDQGAAVHRRGWTDCDDSAAGATTLVVGAYPVDGDIGARLLDSLPPVLRVTDDSGACRFIADEAASDRPGQQVVLDRLLDWILVCTLRAWFDDPANEAPGWYSALHDPVVGRALDAIHDDPAAGWTVAALADRAGVSRATLAKRFSDLLGEPPLAYLTRWRMTVASDLLLGPGTIAQVAHDVGYADAFGFSAAFKRVKGRTPSEHRARSRTGSELAAAASDVP